MWFGYNAIRIIEDKTTRQQMHISIYEFGDNIHMVTSKLDEKYSVTNGFGYILI